MEQELIKWACPQCGENNWDLPDQETHCAYCGRVVWVGNETGQYWDKKWNVPMPDPDDSGSRPAGDKWDNFNNNA